MAAVSTRLVSGGRTSCRRCWRRRSTASSRDAGSISARLYRESHAYEDVFQIAERLVDWDQRLIAWRTVHLKLVERIIGGHVIGTQGTPVEVLGRRLDVRFFPALWDIRNALTAEAQTSPPER